MDQTWCPVCPVAVKGELLRCNEATAEQGLSLTIQDWEELQAKLFALLARQVRNYTKGESDSVPVETAQALFEETWAAKVAPESWVGVPASGLSANRAMPVGR